MKIQLLWIGAIVSLLLMVTPALAIDADGDGHDARTTSGGDDCDDRDLNRYPGNHERCDNRSHDEDCNPQTYGNRDEDGDGLIDNRCCNINFDSYGRSTDGRRFCGLDCDDGNRAIQTDSQVCNGERILICGPDGKYIQANCPNGTICVVQPNRTGICIARPAGYVAPPSRGSAQPAALSPSERNRVTPVPRTRVLGTTGGSRQPPLRRPPADNRVIPVPPPPK